MGKVIYLKDEMICPKLTLPNGECKLEKYCFWQKGEDKICELYLDIIKKEV